MTPLLLRAYVSEMEAMKAAHSERRLDLAFYHLERAHILGQRHFKPHLTTHWWMLKIGFSRRDMKEIFGQVIRILAVAPASIFGWVPIGNTGGANVSALKPMPMPEDLVDFFKN